MLTVWAAQGGPRGSNSACFTEFMENITQESKGAIHQHRLAHQQHVLDAARKCRLRTQTADP